ncbi:hypothetical protein PYCC9005_001803 [Savitreella phatthalungensis]
MPRTGYESPTKALQESDFAHFRDKCTVTPWPTVPFGELTRFALSLDDAICNHTEFDAVQQAQDILDALTWSKRYGLTSCDVYEDEVQSAILILKDLICHLVGGEPTSNMSPVKCAQLSLICTKLSASEVRLDSYEDGYLSFPEVIRNEAKVMQYSRLLKLLGWDKPLPLNECLPKLYWLTFKQSSRLCTLKTLPGERRLASELCSLIGRSSTKFTDVRDFHNMMMRQPFRYELVGDLLPGRDLAWRDKIRGNDIETLFSKCSFTDTQGDSDEEAQFVKVELKRNTNASQVSKTKNFSTAGSWQGQQPSSRYGVHQFDRYEELATVFEHLLPDMIDIMPTSVKKLKQMLASHACVNIQDYLSACDRLTGQPLEDLKIMNKIQRYNSVTELLEDLHRKNRRIPPSVAKSRGAGVLLKHF